MHEELSNYNLNCIDGYLIVIGMLYSTMDQVYGNNLVPINLSDELQFNVHGLRGCPHT